jgi:60S ribosomal subunit assembly/export protein LOC1
MGPMKRNARTTPKEESTKRPKTSLKTRHPPKAKQEVKTHRTAAAAGVKKKRKYTAEELGVPKLNGIIPAGVQKPKGKKKGKIFVDDAESMLAIMGMVQAEKEGEREGKFMKQRQLEEIREAKKVETEKRTLAKQAKLVRLYILYSLCTLLSNLYNRTKSRMTFVKRSEILLQPRHLSQMQRPRHLRKGYRLVDTGLNDHTITNVQPSANWIKHWPFTICTTNAATCSFLYCFSSGEKFLEKV